MEHRLAYFCSSTSWGGLEMNQLRNALWMKERGHEVFIFCKKESPIYNASQLDGIPTISIGEHKKYYDFKAGKLLASLLDENGISHLILRDTRDISLGVIAKRKANRAIHLSYFLEMQLGVSKRNILHTIRYKYLDLWSCPLHSLAEQVKTMTRFDEKKITVIPSGLDLSRFRDHIAQEEARKLLNLPLDKKIIGLSGRFDPQKGQVLLLEAFHKLKDSNTEICFLGEPTRESGPEYVNLIHETIARYNLENRVHIRPFRKDIETFYAAIDYFVMASHAETFGMVTIEAMTSGLTVIASNGGGTPEILGQGKFGYLFEPKNEASLMLKLQEAIAHSEFPDKKALSDAVQKFDHHHVCHLVEQALKLG